MAQHLDLARWTPEGFVLLRVHSWTADGPAFCPGSKAEAIGIPAAGPSAWRDWSGVRLVIARDQFHHGPDVALATLRRDDFCAPQWLRECDPWPFPPGLSPEDAALVRQNRRPVPVLSDAITLDATAPGWRDGDVVAVVGAAREGDAP